MPRVVDDEMINSVLFGDVSSDEDDQTFYDYDGSSESEFPSVNSTPISGICTPQLTPRSHEGNNTDLSLSQNDNLALAGPSNGIVVGVSRPSPTTPDTRPPAKRPRLIPPGNNWTNVTDSDFGPTNQIPLKNDDEGPVLPQHFDSDTKPVEYFDLFFSEDILTHICIETNKFANKKKNNPNNSESCRIKKWNDCDLVSIRAFLGVIVNMGLNPKSDITDYFSNMWVRRYPFFRDVFTRDEFLLLFWNLHFYDEDTSHDPNDRSRKIKPIIDHIRSKCMLHYTPSSFVSVDESTISFKGRIVFKVYNPMKPSKYGIKVFVLSDSKNGYIFDFLPYTGKQVLIPDSDLLKTTQIVTYLCSSLIKDPDNSPTGTHVFTDRYYSSPELADELFKMNFVTTGTVMQNRKNIPPELKKLTQKMSSGEIVSFRFGNKLVLSWKDKKVVTMISTKHKGDKNETSLVPSKWPTKPPTSKPNVIIDYTKHMGGVDRSDHFISNYQFLRQTKKWYRKVFFWLLEVGLVNAYLIYKMVQTKSGTKPMTHKSFRESIVEDLVSEQITKRKSNVRKRGRPPTGPPEERLSNTPHFMDRKEKGAGRCFICKINNVRRETIYFCKTCTDKPFLHPDKCFERYHTVKNL